MDQPILQFEATARNRAHRQSQRERLLDLLLSRKGKRVKLPEIQRLGIAQHSPRFNELRRRGYIIHNKMETAPDGSKHSWYILLAEPGETLQRAELASALAPPTDQEPQLFDAANSPVQPDRLAEVSLAERARMRRRDG